MFTTKILLSITLTIVVFSGLILYGDFDKLMSHIKVFPIIYFMAAIALTTFNYLLRFLRWEYYLRTLQIKVPTTESALIFIAGLGMALTPWKIGEVLKGYFLQRRHQISISISAPVVFMERITDVVAIISLGLIGIKWLPPLLQIFLCISAIFLATGWYFASRHGDRIAKIPGIRRWNHQLEIIQDTSHQLNKPKTVVVASTISLFAWASEGTALWVILLGLDSSINLNNSITIYCVSTLIGAITTLPGGLIGTEGTMVALLEQLGNRTAAVASTLLVRAATLWFALLIGAVAILYLSRHKHSRISTTEINSNFNPDA